MKHSLLALALIASLAACASFKLHTHMAEKPTLRLTLLPLGPVAPGQPVTVTAKINDTESRILLTPGDLAQPLQLIVADRALNDVALVTPAKTSVAGVYNFTFTPKSASGYRVWADVKRAAPKPKAAAEEFPAADLGPRKAEMHKTETTQAAIDGKPVTLTFDHPPMDDEEATGTLHAPAGTTGSIIGIYSDYSMFRTQLNPDGTFPLAPQKPGYVKLFAALRINGRDVLVPFGITIAKAE